MSSVLQHPSSLFSFSPRTQLKYNLPQQLCPLAQLTLPNKPLPSLNLQSRRSTPICRCSTTPSGTGPGENESKTVLDAFFLGKAIGEALSERIESTVGEFLSTLGRFQAEQQKQVQEFQEEVLDRAKKAKEKAARETLEAQGHIPKPATPNTSFDAITIAAAPPSPSNASSTYPNSNAQTFNRESDLTE